MTTTKPLEATTPRPEPMPIDASPRPVGRAARIAATLAAVITLAWHLPSVNEAFGFDLEGMNGAVFEGSIQKHYDRFGFWQLAGRPVIAAVPSEPPQLVLYAHHPPLLYWMVRPFVAAFGQNELGLRLFAILCTAMTAAALTLAASRIGGVALAFLAAVVFGTLPAILNFGRMPNYEIGLLLFATLAFWRLPSLTGKASAPISGILLGVGTLVDWPAALFVPAFLVHEWIVLGRRPPVRVALALGLPILFAALGYFVLLTTWTGSVRIAANDLLDAAGSTTGFTNHIAGFGGWLMEVSTHLREMFGWGGLIGMGIAVVVMAIRPAEHRRALAATIAWTMAATLNVVLFPFRAQVHEYWWYYLAPAVVFSNAWLVAWLLRRTKSRARWLWLAVTCLLVALGVVDGTRRHAAANPEGCRAIANGLSKLYDKDTLLLCLSKEVLWPLSVYLQPWVLPGEAERGLIEGRVSEFKRGGLSVHRLVILGTSGSVPGFATIDGPLRQRLLDLGMVSWELRPGLVAYELKR